MISPVSEGFSMQEALPDSGYRWPVSCYQSNLPVEP